MSDFIVEHLTKSVGDKTVFRDISFIIHDFDRIGIIGVNGTGKTTLLDVISGRLGFDGDVSPFSAKNGYKVAYLTQEPEFDDNKTILDTVLSSDLREMTLIKTYETLMANYDEANQDKLEKVMAEMDSLDAWAIESEVKTVLTKLGLEDLSQKVGDLSGGLRRRVQLAQVLLNDADLLLLDEPTNHLDIASKEILEQALNNYTGTVLYVSHDRYFINQTATRILDLVNQSFVNYIGNYDYYLEKKEELTAAYTESAAQTDASSEETASESKLDWQAQKELQAKERKRQNDLKKLEEKIQKLEEASAKLDEELAKPEYAMNSKKLMDITNEKAEIDTKLWDLYEQWESLAE